MQNKLKEGEILGKFPMGGEGGKKKSQFQFGIFNNPEDNFM